MPSSYDNELGVELQAAGENLNTWGQPKLNNALKRLVKGVAGFIEKPLTGNVTLTSSNSSTDANDFEARHAAIKFTGSGAFIVTVPSSPKAYVIWNACTGELTVTTGVGDEAKVAPGEKCSVQCDGVNVFKIRVVDYGAEPVSTSAKPISANHLVNKSYVDGLAFAQTDLPGQGPGTNGSFVKSDGATASWSAIEVGDVEGAAPLASPRFTGGAVVQDLTVEGGLSISSNISVGGDLTILGNIDFQGGESLFPKYLSGGEVVSVGALDLNLIGIFKEYIVSIRNASGSISGSMRGVFSFDGGISYKQDTGDYIYQYYWQENGGFVSGGAAQSVAMILADNVATSSGGMDLSLRVLTAIGQESRVISDWSQMTPGSTSGCKSGRNTSVTNGKSYGRATHLRLIVNSGTLTCGYSIYGIA